MGAALSFTMARFCLTASRETFGKTSFADALVFAETNTNGSFKNSGGSGNAVLSSDSFLQPLQSHIPR